MRVLVTGGAGFLGRHLTRSLQAQGHQVSVLDLKSQVESERVDLRNGELVSKAFDRFRPDAVVHFGALASVPECERHPQDCFAHNVVGTWNVFRAAAERRPRTFFASTAAVYGEPDELPTPSTAPVRPVNLYGQSKAVGEQVARAFDPDITIFRMFNVYGPGCERSYVIPDTIRKILSARGTVPMMGTGRESRDFVYIDDVVDAFVGCLDTPRPGTYNVGSGETITVRALARDIARMMGRSDLVFDFEGPRPGDFSINWAMIRPPHAPPGWVPHTELKTGLRTMIQELRPPSPRRNASRSGPTGAWLPAQPRAVRTARARA